MAKNDVPKCSECEFSSFMKDMKRSSSTKNANITQKTTIVRETNSTIAETIAVCQGM